MASSLGQQSCGSVVQWAALMCCFRADPQHLKVGDSVVYEVVSQLRVRAHILRAADFEPRADAAASPSPVRPRRRASGYRRHDYVPVIGAAGAAAQAEPRRDSPSPEVEYFVCNGSPSQGEQGA